MISSGTDEPKWGGAPYSGLVELRSWLTDFARETREGFPSDNPDQDRAGPRCTTGEVLEARYYGRVSPITPVTERLAGVSQKYR